MNGRRRRVSPWPLAGLALALLLVPAAFSQKLRLAALGCFLPVSRLARAAAGFRAGGAGTLRTENDFLRGELQQKQGEIDALRARFESATGSRQVVKAADFRLLPADVVLPTDGSPWRKSLTIAVGTRAGAQKGMLVLYNNHLVGRVAETGPWTSRVLCATDPAFRAGAVAVPRQLAQGISFEKRHLGLYKGTSADTGLLVWLKSDAPVELDALVLTTEDPLNGVPRGLVLGRVSKLSTARGLFPEVAVEPLVDPRSLEHVSLLVPAGLETAGR
jgi:cell shape-determining protein MreC